MTKKEQAKILREKYKTLKAKALSMYYDPIDFPSEVKQRLQSLSRQASELDPKVKTETAIKKEEASRKAKSKKKYDVIKEVNMKFPNLKEAEKLISLNKDVGYAPSKLKKEKSLKANKALESSSFRTWTEVRTLIIKANAYKKSLK